MREGDACGPREFGQAERAVGEPLKISAAEPCYTHRRTNFLEVFRVGWVSEAMKIIQILLQKRALFILKIWVLKMRFLTAFTVNNETQNSHCHRGVR